MLCCRECLGTEVSWGMNCAEFPGRRVSHMGGLRRKPNVCVCVCLLACVCLFVFVSGEPCLGWFKGPLQRKPQCWVGPYHTKCDVWAQHWDSGYRSGGPRKGCYCLLVSKVLLSHGYSNKTKTHRKSLQSPHTLNQTEGCPKETTTPKKKALQQTNREAGAPKQNSKQPHQHGECLVLRPWIKKETNWVVSLK